MLFDYLNDDLILANSIDSELYKTLDVKRGLRNADGSGVLAGLSKISSVMGVDQLSGSNDPIDGVLKYRGVSIDDLVQSLGSGERFESVIFLLLIGRQPTNDELTMMNQFLFENRQLSRELINQIRSLPSKNIMNKLQTVVSSMYVLDGDPETLDPMKNFYKSLFIISKLPYVVAVSYLFAYETNPTIVSPLPGMGTAESLLYILRQGVRPSLFEIEILDLALMLHAEHGGGNNSSFTTYVVTSAGTDIYGTITAALGSLKGPLHGAANKKVMDMMSDIKANVSDWKNSLEVSSYLKKIINKEAGDGSGKLYGLGHAVYTKSDPRATLLKMEAKKLANQVNRMDEFELYCLIADIGPKAFYDVKKSDKIISPNVDFFSGFVYDCLKIPVQVYTPIFAIARTVGWCAHRIEEILSGKRVIRPKYKFVK